MNKNCKKSIALLISAMVVVGTTFSAFADTTNTVNEKKQERKVPENMIIGKITAIDASNVTIQVATRKEMEKKENGEKGNPPEKPADGQLKQDGTTPPEKPNMDSMFTLTGETKTINIASADFGKKMPQIDKDNMKNKTEDEMKKEMEEAMKNAIAKTYQDYKVGDYIQVEATDNTYATAKRVSNAMGGGGMRGFKGNGEKSENINKNQ